MAESWTLIIVDDSAADRKIYRRYLLKDTQLSYEIFEADSGEDALNVCQNHRCDVILLDYCLPDMTGIDFLKQLQLDVINTCTSVIMLTGQGDEEIAVQAMKEGVQDYLVKQRLNQDVLQLAVRNAIEKSYLQTQLNRTRERQRLIATTALRIRQSLDLEQILYTAVMEIHQMLRCDRVLVYQLTSECKGQVIADSVSSVVDALYGDELHPNGFLLRDFCPVPESYFPVNVITSHDNCSCSLILDNFHSSDYIMIPIILPKNGKPKLENWGFLIALHDSRNHSHQRNWLHDEREMLQEVSVQLAIAIQQSQLLSQTQAALEKEKQLNVFKSQIVATVSHEYRTPLTSILSAATTLKQHGQKLEETRKIRFLEIIEDKARYLSKIIDEMLIINQIELDKIKFQPIPIDLLNFFSQLIEEQRLIVETKHNFNFYNTGIYNDFWGDVGLLRQIFANLISNAIKYSIDGGDINCHLIGQESSIIFSIQDRGIGIPIADQSNLFQTFSRASNVGTIPGTGLGLIITKACVDLHGGSIALESQEGEGTKVTVCLPKRHHSFIKE